MTRRLLTLPALQGLHKEVQDALNEPEPHDYYERLERMERLIKILQDINKL
jgi:hypothetical protein